MLYILVDGNVKSELCTFCSRSITRNGWSRRKCPGRSRRKDDPLRSASDVTRLVQMQLTAAGHRCGEGLVLTRGEEFRRTPGQRSLRPRRSLSITVGHGATDWKGDTPYVL